MSLKDLFPIFANNIFPIMLISMAGFVLGRTIKIDTRSIGRVSFYFFNPVLVFNILLANKLPVTEMFNTAVFTILVTLGSGLIALLGGQILKLDKKTQISTLLTSMFANNGNYGLPLIAFAFGEQALSHASLYFVFASLITNTLGIFIASMGHMSIKQAFLGIFRIPTIYAVMAALLINSLNLTMPLPIERTVSILTGAGVPVMILLLGLELSNMKWTNSFKALGLAASVRLIVGPLLGVGFAALLGMQGVGMKAGIVDASMSSAVANANLASEYELDSSLVAATILVTTLLSPLTLTPLILLLG